MELTLVCGDKDVVVKMPDAEGLIVSHGPKRV
jgi:hypothetical protein